MTPEQINETIAHETGIVSADQHGPLYKTDGGYVRDCPDFYGSLDAIVPVVRGSDSINDVFDELFLILGSAHPVTMSMAAPSQWCEAYLRAKGLIK